MSLLSKLIKIARVLKVIFLERIPINLSILILIIIISIAGFNYLKPIKTPTGNIILEQQCPESMYEEEPCEQDCDLCPVRTKVETKNVIYYQCPGGALVQDLEECENFLPNVSEEYSGTVSGITLSIDNIEYEKDTEDSGFVTRIDYTIINKGDLPVVPKLYIKVYKEWNLKVRAAPSNRILDPEVVVNPGDYIKRQDTIRIYFKGSEQTLRVLLINTLPDPDKEIVTVTREFSLDYLG